MTRPLTCICVLLAGASGLYLYQSKHQAQMLDREIAHTMKATDVARDRIGVLRGEWAMLNEPERLAALSQAHLGLKTLNPSQFATAAELGARLPPPVLPGTVTILADDAVSSPTVELVPQPTVITPAAAPVAPAPAHANVVVAKQPTPGQPTAAQNQLAVALTPALPRSAARPSEARVFERHEDPTPPRPPMQVASALPTPMAPVPLPRPAAMHPVLAPVVNVSVSPMATPPPPRPLQTRPAPARAGLPAPSAAAPPSRSAPPAPESPSMSAALAPPGYVHTAYNPATASASVLGNNRPLLPPPVPFGSAMAASNTNAR